MFFLVSKAAWLLAQPSHASVLVLLAGLVAAWCGRRLGLKLATAGMVALLLFGFSPAANFLFYPLEQRFAGLAEPMPTDRIAGIIMLGGFEDPWPAATRPGLPMNEAGERLTGTLLLARKFPDAKVIFTGGTASLLDSATGKGAVGRYLLDSGIAPDRIVLEDQSRTTYENALYLQALLHPAPGQRYLLVTSAFHMPRSVGTFRKLGFEVVPYPVDYRTRGAVDLVSPFWDLPEGLRRSDFAAKEWVGLIAYWLSRRSDALWPGP
jgi:uncharacterized SAM-binding protein YcdF (DUF218 family)